LFVTVLFVILVLAALVYAGWRATQSRAHQPTKRVIGPDDDPEFMWRLSHGDNNPR
jgi:lipopolysaccharide export system protein LptC